MNPFATIELYGSSGNPPTLLVLARSKIVGMGAKLQRTFVHGANCPQSSSHKGCFEVLEVVSSSFDFSCLTKDIVGGANFAVLDAASARMHVASSTTTQIDFIVLFCS
mmetsp:Transcript_19301/g.43532  ORF Transcript_19301/g.43532 Transcript_19301/m.43532 type:complete len:108 (+) Transcript_19301:671-994(+)